MKIKGILFFFTLALFLAALDIFTKYKSFQAFGVVIFEPQYRFSMKMEEKAIDRDDYDFSELQKNFKAAGIELSPQARVIHFGLPEECWLQNEGEVYLLSLRGRETRVSTHKEPLTRHYYALSPYLFAPYSYKPLTVIPSFFSIKVAFNRGAMWSSFHGQVTLLTMLAIIAIGFIFYLVLRNPHSFLYLSALAFITAGAMGNLWDRIHYKGVRDFLDFYIGRFHWPTFNAADIFIVVGIGLFLIMEYRNSKNVS